MVLNESALEEKDSFPTLWLMKLPHAQLQLEYNVDKTLQQKHHSTHLESMYTPRSTNMNKEQKNDE